MKKIEYLIVVLGLLLMTSCSDVLENEPYSFTSPDNFYKSAKDAEIALNGVYHVLSASNVQGIGNQPTFSRNLGCMLQGGTDEMWSNINYNNGGFAPFGVAGVTPDNSLLGPTWGAFYGGINRANYLIEKLVGINDLSDNRKMEMEGEARLLRGFYQMTLSMMFGGVPTYTTSEQDPLQERQSIEEVYTQIIADYEFAYNSLPNRASELSHVNKWTAAGLLARAHTYLASAKTSGLPDFGLEINSFAWVNADNHYQKALTYTTAVVLESGYELIENYDYLFRETTKSYQYQETLLAAEASTSSGMQVINMLVNGFCPQGNAGTRGGSYGFFRPSGELFNKYVDADKRFTHNLTGNLRNASPIEEIDGVRYYVPWELNPSNWTYSCGKFRAMDPSQKTIANWASSINYPLLRLADILLLHAEAQYFTGDETGARNTFTIVRSRSVADGFTVDDMNTAYYKADFVDELLDERSRELCFESIRRFDLARFNKFDEAIESLSPDFGFYNNVVPTIKQNWKPERVWFPIPLQQLDLNPNLLPQNSGY
jgi:hypothetical protein